MFFHDIFWMGGKLEIMDFGCKCKKEKKKDLEPDINMKGNERNYRS